MYNIYQQNMKGCDRSIIQHNLSVEKIFLSEKIGSLSLEREWKRKHFTPSLKEITKPKPRVRKNVSFLLRGLHIYNINSMYQSSIRLLLFVSYFKSIFTWTYFIQWNLMFQIAHTFTHTQRDIYAAHKKECKYKTRIVFFGRVMSVCSHNIYDCSSYFFYVYNSTRAE